MEVVHQLREELFGALQRKEVLEKELDSMKFCIAVLQRELQERSPNL